LRMAHSHPHVIGLDMPDFLHTSGHFEGMYQR
jgi:hypothetical protein